MWEALQSSRSYREQARQVVGQDGDGEVEVDLDDHRGGDVVEMEEGELLGDRLFDEPAAQDGGEAGFQVVGEKRGGTAPGSAQRGWVESAVLAWSLGPRRQRLAPAGCAFPVASSLAIRLKRLPTSLPLAQAELAENNCCHPWQDVRQTQGCSPALDTWKLIDELERTGKESRNSEMSKPLSDASSDPAASSHVRRRPIAGDRRPPTLECSRLRKSVGVLDPDRLKIVDPSRGDAE